MADRRDVSVEEDAVPSTKKAWIAVESALGLLGFILTSAAFVMILDYKKTQRSDSLFAALEQPDFFHSYPDQDLFVSRTLVENAVQRGAVCLDGSPPAYHLHRGSGPGVNSWLIHLEGGGWCSTSNACLRRSGTRLGSSHYMDENVIFSGSLSNSPWKNPEFYNWNRVKVRYCDGGSFSGDVESPLEITLDKVKQLKNIYFRGQRVWQAVLDELLAIGLKDAEKALLSGCSAGALASIIHCDSFQNQLPQTAVVKCLSDAGLFLDVKDVMNRSVIQSFYEDVVSLHGIASQLPNCSKEIAKCFFPQYLLDGIKTPLFVLNPAYDTWQIENILVPVPEDRSQDWRFCMRNPAECSEENLKVLQDFRLKLLEVLDAVQHSDKIGIFINSCFTHCQSEMDMTWHRARTPVINQRTISEAVGDWFYRRQPAKDIDCAYPCNPSCFK